MLLKLNVGLARKVGEANYGSRGASINVEMEVDSSLVSDPPRLNERIRGLFNFVRHAVDEELGCPNQRLDPSKNGSEYPRLSGPEQRPSDNGGTRNGRPATQSQVKAIYSISRAQKIDLAVFLREQFQVHRVEDLSLKQASQAIDALKADTKGR